MFLVLMTIFYGSNLSGGPIYIYIFPFFSVCFFDILHVQFCFCEIIAHQGNEKNCIVVC